MLKGVLNGCVRSEFLRTPGQTFVFTNDKEGHKTGKK